MPLRSETKTILPPVGVMNVGIGVGRASGPPASAGGADPAAGAPPSPPQAEARSTTQARTASGTHLDTPRLAAGSPKWGGSGERDASRESVLRGGLKRTGSAEAHSASLRRAKGHRVPASISLSGGVDSGALRTACQASELPMRATALRRSAVNLRPPARRPAGRQFGCRPKWRASKLQCA